MVLLIMGVAGVGKTTVGRELARQLGWTFLDADDDHAPEAIARMKAGTSLTDAERIPWLERVRARVLRHIEQGENVVLACSALKEAYRQYLRDVPGEVFDVQLVAPRSVIAKRLQHRVGNFAGENLLDGQISTLEPAANTAIIDASADVHTIVATIIRAMPGDSHEER